MKVLVTGAKGQLGYKIKEILGTNYELILTDAAEMDITDPRKVDEVLGTHKPDWIIHGAAYTRVDQAEDEIDLCRKINATGTENIARAAKEHGAKLIYISTDFVFDGNTTTPYLETDKPNPLSIYGLTKYEGEEFVRKIAAEYYIIRVAWLFGELPKDHPGSNFVETMLRLAKERDLLNIIKDQVGSPTYTGDLVELFEKILERKPAFGIYHFSGKGECSWADFAKEIFNQTNTMTTVKPIPTSEYPQRAERPKYSYLNKSKIEKELNFEVRSWQEMLADYLAKR